MLAEMLYSAYDLEWITVESAIRNASQYTTIKIICAYQMSPSDVVSLDLGSSGERGNIPECQSD